jgi:hypothetical protein
MNCFAFYRKVVALNPDVHRNLESSANEANFSFPRDTTAAPIAGAGFAEPAPSENAQLH